MILNHESPLPIGCMRMAVRLPTCSILRAAYGEQAVSAAIISGCLSLRMPLSFCGKFSTALCRSAGRHAVRHRADACSGVVGGLSWWWTQVLDHRLLFQHEHV